MNSLAIYVESLLMCTALLIGLFVANKKIKPISEFDPLSVILIILVCSCLFDSVWPFINGKEQYLFLSKISNSIYFFATTYIGLLWFNYILKALPSEFKPSRPVYGLMIAVTVLVSLVSLTSVWNGLIFGFNENGEYFRGSLHFIHPGITYIYGLWGCLLSLIASLKTNDKFLKRKYFWQIFYIIPSLAFNTIQMIVPPGLPFTYFGSIISAAIILYFKVYEKSHDDTKNEYRSFEIISILSSKHDFVCYIDNETNEMKVYKIGGIFKQFSNLVGTDGSMSPQTFDAIMHIVIPEDKINEFIAMAKREPLIQQMKNGQSPYIDIQLREKDKRIWYRFNFAFQEEQGNVVLGIANCERAKQRELDLQNAREAADYANRQKTSFLFNMSHDIRTPMNAIIGYTTMAKKHIDDSERAENCLENVEKSGTHLLSLINDVLDMARIESGKVTIDEQPLDIIEASNNLCDIAQPTSIAKNIEFTRNFDNIKHKYILADELRLNRIMMNILNNAMKYTNPGGKVVYTISEIPAKEPGIASFMFKIADNGIGMSEEFQRHIFESFSRETTSSTKGIQGTGLGMAITKQLIDLMHGKIDVKSKLGEGSEFTVYIDFRITDKVVKKAEEPEEADASMLKGKKVLLVEDNELNREIACDILNEFEMEIVEADDGTKAVEICNEMVHSRERYFDLILMDIQMPVMDGYKATREIRTIPDPQNIHIPIIAMTANAFDEDKKKALEAGMDAHISKPININELVTTLSQFVKKE